MSNDITEKFIISYLSNVPVYDDLVYIVNLYAKIFTLLPRRHRTYVTHLEDIQDVFLTSYVRSIYVLCLRGNFRWRAKGLSLWACLGVYKYINKFQIKKVNKVSSLILFLSRDWPFVNNHSVFEVSSLYVRLCLFQSHMCQHYV